jgi:hypothetical protein
VPSAVLCRAAHVALLLLLLLLVLFAGLSLQSQILTFLFLVIRLYCSFMMEYDIHTLLDALTLVATVAVIYALTLTPIKNTYQSDLDSVRWYYVVSGCAKHMHLGGLGRIGNVCGQGRGCAERQQALRARLMLCVRHWA